MRDHTTPMPPSLADEVRRRLAIVEMQPPPTAMPWPRPPTPSQPQAVERPQVQTQAEVSPTGAEAEASSLRAIAMRVAERVYEMMRYDLRIEHERLRGES